MTLKRILDDMNLLITREQLAQLRHDLRTPINQIIGYSELLHEIAEDEGHDDMLDDLNRINKAANDLLTRVEHGMAGMFQTQESSEAVDADEAEAGHGENPEAEPENQVYAVEIPESATDDGRVAHDGGGARLLVVDDSEMNRDMLSRRLRRVGYEVEVASDGQQALEMVGGNSFDAVLLDVMMPGISGLEVLLRVRAEHDMTALPIIMATARNDSEDIVRALELGANDYVTKPIDFSVITARLGTHLKLRAATREIERHNRFIRSVFGRYLSDDIVDSLLDEPEGLVLGGSSREVTILMSDLRGFSSMSERLEPEQVVRLLNIYLARMTEIIQKYQGTIDEFIGDAILVIFGAPNLIEDHAERAVACALEMQLAMDEVNQHMTELGLPAIEMGIGINTGQVVVGNIGSEKRSKYAVVGRNVNLAARIESYTVGGQVLITDATASAVNNAPLALGGSAEVSPKGCKGSLLIHRVQGLGGPFDLALSEASVNLRPLTMPVDVRWAILDGVNVPELSKIGRIVKVSEREAEIELADEELPLLSNVTMELSPPSPEGQIYGKVTKVEQSPMRAVLRFSSIPDSVRNAIEAQLPAA